ncbi:hypothetical protein HKX48_002048 [Thoreauomyces humboldtii]|nr:hypothetical protein HKX48_002048 [Thoreauomyces humboldtii]
MHKIQSWAKQEARSVKNSPFSRSSPTRRRVTDVESQSSIPQQMQSSNSTPHESLDPIQAANANGNDAASQHDGDAGEGSVGGKSSQHQLDPSLWGQLRAAVFSSYVNILLVFVPIGIALHFTSVSPTVVFVANFIAIIPLAGSLSYATEEIAMRTGETIGGLLNASFGNAVELIVAIIALTKNEVIIVQTSLVGSILSNLLLVLGMSFVGGGLNRYEQYFNTTVAQTASSLLALALAALVIPTAFATFAASTEATVANPTASINSPAITTTAKLDDIVKISRATALIMLAVYGTYLLFQLKTHAHLFNEPSKKVPTRKEIHAMSAAEGGEEGGDADRNPSYAAATSEKVAGNEDGDEPQPELTLTSAILLLLASTVCVAFCAEFLVSAIDAVTTSSGISKYFVGLILLPIVGNAAEHVTSVTVACKDKMDLAIGVAIGSSLQVALLIIPLSVVLAWIMGKDEMSLEFDGFQVIILVLAIWLVNYLIQDGKSNFLEGNLLLALYIIIAVAAWFFPAVGQ